MGFTRSLIGIALVALMVFITTNNSTTITHKFNRKPHTELFSGLQILKSNGSVSVLSCAVLCSLTPGSAGFAYSSSMCQILEGQSLGKKPYKHSNGDEVFMAEGEVHILGFRTSTGVGDEPYDVIVSPQNSGSLMSSGDLDTPLSVTFKHPIMERWNDLSITKVDMAFRASKDIIRHIKFNATNYGDKMAWMNKERLLSTPWNDLQTSSTTNFFSVVGTLKRRRFFINHSYNGCPSDYGWFVVLELAPGCDWEKVYNSYPVIIYSKKSGRVNWKDYANVGVATDLLIVLVIGV